MQHECFVTMIYITTKSDNFYINFTSKYTYTITHTDVFSNNGASVTTKHNVHTLSSFGLALGTLSVSCALSSLPALLALSVTVMSCPG